MASEHVLIIAGSPIGSRGMRQKGVPEAARNREIVVVVWDISWMPLFLSQKCLSLGSTLLSRPLLVSCNLKSEASTESPWMGRFECLACVLFLNFFRRKLKLHAPNSAQLSFFTFVPRTRPIMDVQCGTHFKSIILISLVFC